MCSRLSVIVPTNSCLLFCFVCSFVFLPHRLIILFLGVAVAVNIK